MQSMIDISRIQKEICIWPTGSGIVQETASHIGRFDKVIGLIPQAYCMFKVFFYKSDLIKRSEIESCIQNELHSLVSWDHCESFYVVNKVEESWQVAVWFWDDCNITFPREITHKLPAMAYFFSRCSAMNGVLVYHEPFSETESLWALKWHGNYVIEQFYPLSSMLHVRNFRQILEQPELAIFSNQPELPILEGYSLSDLRKNGRQYVLSHGKCSSHFDFENPWQYWRGMVVFSLLIVIYMCLDALLLSHESNQINQTVERLQISSAPLQREQQKMREQGKFLQSFFRAESRQQAPAKLLESLTKSLAKDIIIKRFVMENGKLMLEGTIIDTTGLLNTLSTLPEVEDARLLGDILPTSDGRQEFRAELVLKEAYSWKN